MEGICTERYQDRMRKVAAVLGAVVTALSMGGCQNSEAIPESQQQTPLIKDIIVLSDDVSYACVNGEAYELQQFDDVKSAYAIRAPEASPLCTGKGSITDLYKYSSGDSKTACGLVGDTVVRVSVSLPNGGSEVESVNFSRVGNKSDTDRVTFMCDF